MTLMVVFFKIAVGLLSDCRGEEHRIAEVEAPSGERVSWQSILGRTAVSVVLSLL